MKKITLICSLVILSALLVNCSKDEETPPPQTPTDWATPIIGSYTGTLSVDGGTASDITFQIEKVTDKRVTCQVGTGPKIAYDIGDIESLVGVIKACYLICPSQTINGMTWYGAQITLTKDDGGTIICSGMYTVSSKYIQLKFYGSDGTSSSQLYIVGNK